jgi:hypothetical protein
MIKQLSTENIEVLDKMRSIFALPKDLLKEPDRIDYIP